MPRKIALFVLSYLLFIIFLPRPISAQSNFDSFFEWIKGGIEKTQVDKELQKSNESQIPFRIRITPGDSTLLSPIPTATEEKVQAAQSSVDAFSNTVGQYTVGTSIKIPRTSETVSNNPQSFLEQFIQNISSFIGFGNKKATDYANSRLPKGVGDTLTAQNKYEKIALENSTGVLAGQSDQNQAMLKAQPLVKCSSLPYQASQACIASAQISPFETPSPTISTTIITPTEFPSQLTIVPTSPALFSCDITDDVSPTRTPEEVSRNVCRLGSSYCSVGCLTKAFNGDVQKAKIASRICQRESGSDPLQTNFSCLNSDDGRDNDEWDSQHTYRTERDGPTVCKDRSDTAENGCNEPNYRSNDNATVDYSVGLFQINLLPETRCPGAFIYYTWDPPACKINNSAVLQACVAQLKDPYKNIERMISMSGNGTNWQPWRAPGGCLLE